MDMKQGIRGSQTQMQRRCRADRQQPNGLVGWLVRSDTERLAEEIEMTVATGSEAEVTWRSLSAAAPSPACTLQTLGTGDSGERSRQKKED
ncbi:hypothetical protein TgHK011_005109 [Trichoderma gracile]|nr:hypothetical protein TgHK011_005109 [Trichoderma gracile]